MCGFSFLRDHLRCILYYKDSQIIINNEKFHMQMKTDYYFILYLTLHDNNTNYMYL